METFGALLGLIGLAGVPIAIGVLIYSLVKKNKAIKKYSLIGLGASLLIFTLAVIFVDKLEVETTNEDKVVQQDTSTTEKEEVEKESSSTETETSETIASSSSEPVEEPFDPATYPLVDFNAWNHDDVEYASKLQVTGTVIQAMKSDQGVNLRLAINDDYDQVVLITIEDSDYQDVIAENDNVTVYGLNAGLISYETVMGNEQTVPGMLGTNYTVNSYGQ
ncbi:hypothetical protein [Streptococcus parasuis]|uniref:hypothetical protein n=1 Tax=Streptococcus parasuis TaxID=1501662 RepID=UPI002FE22D59